MRTEIDSKKLSIDDIRDRIVATEKVAHVTFYMVNDAVDAAEEDYYRVYSQNGNLGIHLVSGSFEYQQLDCRLLEDAQTILSMEIQKLEGILDRKRDERPTQKQILFLFDHKIPIPVDMTWGIASDLIDGCLSRIAKDKQAKRLKCFNGFTEGDRVSFSLGKNSITGGITKLYQAGSAGKFAIVEVGQTTYRIQERDFDRLHKVHSDSMI